MTAQRPPELRRPIAAIAVPESDIALLAQCDVYTFRASGKGGQHLHKTESAVRLRHRPTGIVVSSQQERSQVRNKAICLARLRRRIAEALVRPTPRIATRRPFAVRQRILDAKARQGRRKRQRARPAWDE